MKAELKILSPGLSTTLQDLGRIGQQALGISVSGAMDQRQHRLANALLGNMPGAPALEFTLVGPTIEVTAPLGISIVGDCTLAVDGHPIASNCCFTLEPGQRLAVGPLATQRFGTLGFAATPSDPPILGSYATHARTGVGGLNDDFLKLIDPRPVAARRIGSVIEPAPDVEEIAFLLGPQEDFFSAATIAAFQAETCSIDQLSDRMGYRLNGPALSHLVDKGANITSDGISLGSIQVPANGSPIVLMADRQTMGGYPKIGTVVSADIPRLAQRRPGSKVRFTAISAAEGIARRRALEREIVERIASISTLTDRRPPTPNALLGNNLISGVLAPDIAW